MEKIPIPNSVKLISEEGNEAVFEISPYFPGYGPTLGNALRRVLLSSLPGAAVTSVRIDGVDHEFSTINGVKEDVVSILLNLKQMRLKVFSDRPIELSLKVKGDKVVKAKDFEKNSEVEIINKEMVIANLTDAKSELVLRVMVKNGRGYVPVEVREGETRDLGEIAVDAIYTPVERVSFRVENVRVGQETEFHKLMMTIRTDGTISPREALSQAASILEDHFKELVTDLKERLTVVRETIEEVVEPVAPVVAVDDNSEKGKDEEEKTAEGKTLPIQRFAVSTRIQNILEKEGIRTVAGLVQKTPSQLLDFEGMGDKAVEEIATALKEMDLSLKEEKNEE
jgi:DNA-directed RNA polymerase subunit alpha